MHGDAVAAALLEEFGSLGHVLGATDEAIERVTGAGSAAGSAVSCLRSLLHCALSTQLGELPLLDAVPALVAYLRLTIGHSPVEIVRVLYLDNSKRLIRDELAGTGSVRGATIYPRAIFKRAFELNATGLILVHNHPSGTTEPSRADRNLTGSLYAVGKDLEITLYDHLIVGPHGYSSFLELGLL